ncbi:YeeE/YedE family protein [Aestuariivirga sp.]|uniref:YeeE/YedE family protein n=1 Tax=Aestuariivirga sp. TaxID=2650926 RepID=UPI0035931342
MTDFTPLAGTMGGILIGLSAVLLMGGIGRIAGLSGILGGIFTTTWTAEQSWRALFLAGTLGGAVVVALLGGIDPEAITFPGTPLTTALGGLLVGFGTALGAGCTSGHGICGISRLSVRSIVSTVVFMAVAVLTVFVVRHAMGG